MEQRLARLEEREASAVPALMTRTSAVSCNVVPVLTEAAEPKGSADPILVSRTGVVPRRVALVLQDYQGSNLQHDSSDRLAVPLLNSNMTEAERFIFRSCEDYGAYMIVSLQDGTYLQCTDGGILTFVALRDETFDDSKARFFVDRLQDGAFHIVAVHLDTCIYSENSMCYYNSNLLVPSKIAAMSEFRIGWRGDTCLVDAAVPTDPAIPRGVEIVLQGFHGKSLQNDQKNRAVCRNKGRQHWEWMMILPHESGSFVLKSTKDGAYLSADDNGCLFFDANPQKFDVQVCGHDDDDFIRLRFISSDRKTYVEASDDEDLYETSRCTRQCEWKVLMLW
jgi:hypothetical protein